MSGLSMDNAKLLALSAAILIVMAGGDSQLVADDAAPPPALIVPDGFTIELAAGPPLVERPIVAAFDDEGRLYVAESSGSNDPVEKQLELRPHRIVRLEDVDGDGKFDERTVFADRMMFPAGAMLLDGSLYVSAPPSIWRLTDTDGDGVADERIEWFQGKTLTYCANDLHGPYLGPDGWVYWCKGAFAEQTHLVNGREWKSRAAHIFRCRPDGTGFEPVMTGGMDNPVDVVFTPDGERILSATFLEGEGRRDGIIHAIYGGVYGKQHGVLDSHPRTGELMPPLVLMNSAAPSGLERYENDALGAEYRDNLFLSQFNLRKVSRHVLRTAGSSYQSDDSDFVVSENVDFHPTDVLMDADGSLLVIDTGGWYKLCCPTSQLWKPDILGGIYRVRRVGAVAPDDPRGQRIAWSEQSAEQLWGLLSDIRPAVRQRASREFVRQRGSKSVRVYVAHLASSGIAEAISSTGAPSRGNTESCDAQTASLGRVWVLSQLESAESRAMVRDLLLHADAQVRHAALNAVSLHRDAEAGPRLLELLASDTAANRRVAAEALGRLGDPTAVGHLLAAAANADDRILQHSVTYALIEIGDLKATQVGIASESSGTARAALLALDQMPGGGVRPGQVIPLLDSQDEGLRRTAHWLVTRHSEWGAELGEWFRQELAALTDQTQLTEGPPAEFDLEPMLAGFASHPSIQKLLAETTVEHHQSIAARQLALRVMKRAKLSEPPPSWSDALVKVIADFDPELLPLAVAAAGEFPPAAIRETPLAQSLITVVESPQLPQQVRVEALAAVVGAFPEINEPQFELLIDALSPERSVALRSLAADAISQAHLSPRQLERLCDVLPTAGPLEITRLLLPFERTADERLGLKLLSSLKGASALASLRIDVLRQALAGHSSAVQQGIGELESHVNVDAAAQRHRIEELLPKMADGDTRRGHAVFHSSKAACSTCHRLAYGGGTMGPELTRIGETRTERDLLESILFPSLSFVRSYEPVLIITNDGRTISGVIRDENDDEYLVEVNADQQVSVRRDEVAEIEPSLVSVMPAGLDRQLSTQELADLVAFLKNATGK